MVDYQLVYPCRVNSRKTPPLESSITSDVFQLEGERWQLVVDKVKLNMGTLNTNQSFVMKSLCWILSLSLVYLSIYLFAFLGREGWDVYEITFQLGVILIAFGTLAYTVSPKRFAWGLRLVTFVIFLSFFSYFFNQFVVQQSAFAFTVSRSSTTTFNALLGFLIIGVPCLMYSLWGSIWGNIQKNRDDEIERNTLSFYIALATQWVFLLLSFFSIVYYFFN